jgi:hypothetical protein
MIGSAAFAPEHNFLLPGDDAQAGGRLSIMLRQISASGNEDMPREAPWRLWALAKSRVTSGVRHWISSPESGEVCIFHGDGKVGMARNCHRQKTFSPNYNRQLVEMVKLTVILAWVSTVSMP